MASDSSGATRSRGALACLILLGSLLASLAACAPASASTGTRPADGRDPATSHLAVAATVRLGPTNPLRTLTLSFPLRRRSPDALAALLAAIADPRSPQYHHYLTAAQYAAAYGPSQQEREQATAAIQALGLAITATGADSGLIQATGPVGRIEADFGVRLYDVRAADGTRYVAADGAPSLPAALSALVSGIVGLDTRPVVRRSISQTSLTTQFSQVTQMTHQSGGGLDPSALRAAYDVAPLTAKGLDGSGVTIALAEIDRFRQSDIATYDSAFALHTAGVQVIPVAGGASSLSPEPVLDIEVLHAIAPKARLLIYESGPDLGRLVQMFDRIVSDNRAQVASISLGACELGVDPSSAAGLLSALDSDFQRADAQGMSILVSSGDSGAYGCQDNHLSVDLPSSSPYVTAVGGTALFLGASDRYGSEDGWEGPLEGSGGGGGLSAYYRRPAWQAGPGVTNNFSNGMRQVPDVSADADPLTGYRIYYSGKNDCAGSDCWAVVGGTSAAAPFWAGLIALADQQGQRKLGFLNPALYALGQASAGGASPFHDVTGGGNLYYPATPGWDYSTGWGSPDSAALVAALLAR